jgi:hypothetical protein
VTDVAGVVVEARDELDGPTVTLNVFRESGECLLTYSMTSDDAREVARKLVTMADLADAHARAKRMGAGDANAKERPQ